MGETGQQMRTGLAASVAAGWTLVTFDHRGHGGATPVHDGRLIDPYQMADEYFAVMDDLEIASAWVGGGSMGAATSLAAAFARPERVEGLAVLSPGVHKIAPVTTDEGFVERVAEAVRREGVDGLVEAWSAVHIFAGSSEQDAQRDCQYLREFDPDSFLCVIRSCMRWVMPEVPEKVAELSVPVAVVGWPDDPVHPMWLAAEIARAARHGALVTTENPVARWEFSCWGPAFLEAVHRLQSEPLQGPG
jgi:pimeloyl-ACP methyl ester carboxylesterase